MKHPETAFSRAKATLVISCAVILMVVASSAAVVSARTADRVDSYMTSGALSAPALQAAVPIIPRQVLLGNPDKAAPSISPDGKELAFLASVNGVLNVWMAPVDRPEAAKPVTQDQGRGIRRYDWAKTGDHIIYLQDKNGDENWHVHVVDLRTGQDVDLTPLEGVQAQVNLVSPRIPEEILVGLNDRDPQLHDFYRINIRTGERRLVLQNPGFESDDDYRVRIAARMNPDGVDQFKTRVGDPTTEEGRALLLERSPLTHVGRITRPLLIGQGANDPRVKQAESDQIVRAMQEKSIPVTYVLYPDEGHGFARPENSLSFFATTEQFLAAHIGGRSEPIGADFAGSSITVPAGAEQIPSLAEALARR